MKRAGRAASTGTPKQDQEILARNPLPPATLALRDFRVNGHRVTFDGELAMAFRLDGAGSLAGVRRLQLPEDGYQRAGICVRQPAGIPGGLGSGAAAKAGARRGDHGGLGPRRGGDELAAPAGVKGGELYFEGGRPGSFGAKVACECSDGVLRFNALNAWPQKHLFFVAA